MINRISNLLRLFTGCLILHGSNHSLSAHPGHHHEEKQASADQPIQIELPTEIRPTLQLSVKKDGQLHQLDLKHYNCRSKNFQLLETTPGGGLREIAPPPLCTYRGTIDGDADSTVVGSVSPKGAHLRITCSNGECWEIENSRNPAEGHRWRHVSWNERQDELREISRMINNPSTLVAALALPREVTVKRAEIGFDIDYPTWSRSDRGGFNRNDALAMQTMEDFVSMQLNSFVISNALVEHVVDKVVLRKSPAEDPYDGMTNATAILEKVRDVWNGTGNTGFERPSTTHDLATGLIGRGIGVAGLGYVGTIAERSRYTIATTTSGSGVGFWFNGVAKHEIAHNWGLRHNVDCGDEFRPAGDVVSWNMCGGFNNQIDSDEARRVIGERDSSGSALEDIGPYTAGNLRPFCPEDDGEANIGGSPIVLDVLRNDYDANNDRFEITRILVNMVEETTSLQGGFIEILDGTGPGGRDQLRYTPPSTGIPGTVDLFYYTVTDERGLRANGQVNVTLTPDNRPKEVNPNSYLADTALDFSDEINPITIDEGIEGEENFITIWEFGSMPENATTFTRATGQQIDPTSVAGTQNKGWIGTSGTRIHRNSMATGIGHRPVKRWISTYTGDIAIHYDARRVQTGGDGQVPLIQINGNTIWSDALNDTDTHAAGTVFASVNEGDVVDFIVNANANRDSDWIYFHGRIVRADQVKWRYGGAPEIHLKLDAPSTAPAPRLQTAADTSGNKNHGELVNIAPETSRIPTEVGNGLVLDGEDDEIRVEQPATLQGATELTISIWVNPSSTGENRGIVTSQNDTDPNISYFGFLMGPSDEGFPAQFRANRAFINAPSGSLPLDKWSHLTGVWKSGEIQKLYVNGVEVASSTSPPTASIDTNRWIIGRDRAINNRYWDGSIDDLAIWERALSPEEITALYQQSVFARSFNGLDEFDRRSPALLAQGAREITIATWVRANALGENIGIVTSYNQDDINRSYFGLLIGNNEAGRPAQFRAHRKLVNALPGSFPVGQWVHIAGVWRAGQEQSLYIDGAKIADLPLAEIVDEPIDIEQWIIGRDRLIPSRFFGGEVADLVIVDRGFDAAEIESLFNAGRTNIAADRGLIEQAGQIGTDFGNFIEASDQLTLITSGNRIGSSSDSFYFASREHIGDAELTVRLDSVSDTGTQSRGGLMFRQSDATNAPFVMISRTQDDRLILDSRTTTGGNVVTERSLSSAPDFPTYLRLTRRGDHFFGEWSESGDFWNYLASVDVNLADSALVGVASHAGIPGQVNVASFNQFSLSSTVRDFPDNDGDGLSDEWEVAQFGNTDESPDGDTDEDGLPNLIERVFGTDPTIPTPSPISTVITGTPEQIGIRFPFAKDAATQATVILESSDNLIDWTQLSVAPNVIADNGDTETLEFLEPTAITNRPRRFIRLLVQIPE